MVEITHRRHSIGQSAYHLVWRPKYNYSVFRHSFPRRVIIEALNDAAKRWNILIYQMEVMPNHVHLFVEVPPTMTVSFCLQVLKGSSARAFFKRCDIWKRVCSAEGKRDNHLWSPGKFFRSVGSVTANVVESYIKNSNNWSFEFIHEHQKKLKEF
jgi:putative transposase